MFVGVSKISIYSPEMDRRRVGLNLGGEGTWKYGRENIGRGFKQAKKTTGEIVGGQDNMGTAGQTRFRENSVTLVLTDSMAVKIWYR